MIGPTPGTVLSRLILSANTGSLERTDQSVLGLLAPFDRLPAELQQRPDAAMNLLVGGEPLPEITHLAIVATSAQITQCITSDPIVAFCSAIRVRDSWWSGPMIKTLDRAQVEKNATEASDREFWEDVDMLE